MEKTGRRELPLVLKDLLQETVELAKEFYGENLLSLVVYGSVGRGSYEGSSDIDLLLVLKESGQTVGQRITDFVQNISNKIHDSPGAQELRGLGLPHYLMPIIYSLRQFKAHPSLLLDMITDSLVLYDRDDTFKKEINILWSRVKALGGRKVVLPDGSWYWMLKPDIKFGEIIEI